VLRTHSPWDVLTFSIKEANATPEDAIGLAGFLRGSSWVSAGSRETGPSDGNVLVGSAAFLGVRVKTQKVCPTQGQDLGSRWAQKVCELSIVVAPIALAYWRPLAVRLRKRRISWSEGLGTQKDCLTGFAKVTELGQCCTANDCATLRLLPFGK
jgi:hypothetical protein